jgi:hypothetical protein
MDSDSGVVGDLKLFTHKQQVCDVGIFRKVSKEELFRKSFSDEMGPSAGSFFYWRALETGLNREIHKHRGTYPLIIAPSIPIVHQPKVQ